MPSHPQGVPDFMRSGLSSRRWRAIESGEGPAATAYEIHAIAACLRVRAEELVIATEEAVRPVSEREGVSTAPGRSGYVADSEADIYLDALGLAERVVTKPCPKTVARAQKLLKIVEAAGSTTTPVAGAGTFGGLDLAVHIIAALIEDGNRIRAGGLTAPTLRDWAVHMGIDRHRAQSLPLEELLGAVADLIPIGANRDQGAPVDDSPRASTLTDLAQEVRAARKAHPGNAHMLAVLVEKVGDLAKARREAHASSSRVRSEAMQVACVAIRIVEEGNL